MLGNVRQMWQRFFYRDSILLEAQRQKRLFSDEAPWSVEVSKLPGDDDVFATFIQVDLLLNLLCGILVWMLSYLQLSISHSLEIIFAFPVESFGE